MSLKQKFRQIKKWPDWMFFLPSRLLIVMRHLMRFEVIDPEELIKQKAPPAIVTVWHNRLLFFPAVFPNWHRKHTTAVISASRDGSYIADICKQFGIKSVRGSTSRKALNVLIGVTKTILEEKKYVVFTPDGPRGPRYHLSRGPVYLASQTRVPVIPISVNYSAYWQLGSWDGFQIPKPWSKITLELGHSIMIPENLSDEELEQWRVTVEKAMLEITRDRKKE